MRDIFRRGEYEQLIDKLRRIWKDEQERMVIAKTIQALNTQYALFEKIANEPEVEGIIEQMCARLANSYTRLSDLHNKRVLDIACGSNSSKLPATFFLNSLFGGKSVQSNQSFTALFEPWMCRMLVELGAVPVGVDFGDLDGEVFTHHKVDLGVSGALDFLPSHSFDAIQDSRLFGSPEFTAEFPHQAERLKVAVEIVQQERRLLKADGIIIHSDAMQWVK